MCSGMGFITLGWKATKHWCYREMDERLPTPMPRTPMPYAAELVQHLNLAAGVVTYYEAIIY